MLHWLFVSFEERVRNYEWQAVEQTRNGCVESESFVWQLGYDNEYKSRTSHLHHGMLGTNTQVHLHVECWEAQQNELAQTDDPKAFPVRGKGA